MTLGRCPLSIFCSRGTPPRALPLNLKLKDLIGSVTRLKKKKKKWIGSNACRCRAKGGG